MRTSSVIAIVFFFLFLQTAAAGSLHPEPPFFVSIPPQVAAQLLGKDPNMLIVDTRTAQEHAQGVIPGSKPVNFWDVVRGMYEPPRDRPLLLVCAVGGRSYAAGQLLRQKGYGQLYNLLGGVRDWLRAGYSLEPPKAKTE